MSNPSNLGAHLYADESTFGDSSSTTFDERLAVTGNIDTSGLTQEKIPINITQQYLHEGYLDAQGVYGGSFTTSLWLTGHGSTTAGSVTATTEETYLGRVFGGINAAQVGTTVGTPTSATQFTVAGGTQVDGAVMRVGSIGDARGNGQFVAVDNPATVTLLTALDATPNAADVVYAPVNIYPIEQNSSNTTTSTRHQLQTANQRYNCWGCFPQSVTFSGLNAGELPSVSVTHGTSYWQPESASTWPTATSQNTFRPAPVSAGSFFMQDVGTTTRSKLTVRDVQFTVDMLYQPLMGPGMSNARQIITGVRRIRTKGMLSFTIDAEAAGTDTLGGYWTGTTYKHIMYTMSAEDGSALGLYIPRGKVVAARPVQFADGEINRMRITVEATTTTDTSSDLTLASWILAIG